MAFWTALLTAAITAATFVLAVATPPKAGPFCTEGCIGYPYTDFARFIPRDFIWMYPALFVGPLYVMFTAVIHQRTPAGRQVFSFIGIAFAGMAATVLTADYFVQLRVIQPAILNGELDGLAPLTQYNPHGVFIAFEEAGYLLMAISFLFAALALWSGNRLERLARWVFLGGFAAVTVMFVILSTVYGFGVEYRFEVAAITVDWTVLIVACALLARSYLLPPSGARP